MTGANGLCLIEGVEWVDRTQQKCVAQTLGKQTLDRSNGD
jgi:hypothetical protein